MFRNALCMAKVSLKLLLRNRGFLVVGVLLPILATLLLNVLYGSGYEETGSRNAVYELENAEMQMAYQIDFARFPVKVYDADGRLASKALCEQLAQIEMFQIFRADASGLSEEETMAGSRRSALEDKVGAIVIIDRDFMETVLDGRCEKSVRLYQAGEDERFRLFRDSLEQILGKNNQYGSLAEDREQLGEILADAKKRQMDSTITLLERNSGMRVDYVKIREFGYCLAVSTIAFIFGGVLILGVIMKEKQNLILNRILMTRASYGSYVLSKLFLILALTAIQTVVMALVFIFFVDVKIGISIPQFSCLIFLEGLIFSFLSVCVGICCNSISAASFASFVIWSVTSLLAGMYFNITDASETYHKVAMLMPQRWALICATEFQQGGSQAYLTIFIVTAAYLMVIMVIGMLGMRMHEKE